MEQNEEKNGYDVHAVNSSEIAKLASEPLTRSRAPAVRQASQSNEGKRAFAQRKQKKDAAEKGSTQTQKTGGLPGSAVLLILRLSICHSLNPNKKSEPLSVWIKVRILLIWWCLLDSNQWSRLRSVRFAIVACSRCRSARSFTHHASASLHRPQGALRLRAPSMR